MSTRLFSDRDRPVHLGPFPLERLARQDSTDLTAVPPFQPLSFHRPEVPHSIVNAMREHQAMLDAIRDGLVNRATADCPDDLTERANHLKAFAYFCDAGMAGTCTVAPEALLEQPVTNPDVARLAEDLRTGVQFMLLLLESSHIFQY
ncbi:MAG: hypothetical protein AAGF22_11655 [Pseudomonadota bacterium]